jgi:pre-mRNA-splicing factor ISY1
MARNEEKAFTLFNKWQTFKQDFHASRANRRPFLASECDSLQDAEKFRREIVSNLSKNVSAIKNPSLGEHRIRELNDEINKQMKQKYYWELRIRELGGNVGMGKHYYDEGKELPGAPGYRYYGAAKDLPGIKELFEAAEHEETQIQQRKQRKRSRKELSRNITPEYYGIESDQEDNGDRMIEEENVDQQQNNNNNNNDNEEINQQVGSNSSHDSITEKQPAHSHKKSNKSQPSLRELEKQKEREYLRGIPREIPSIESDEEFEQLQQLDQIAQRQWGLVPSTIDTSTVMNNSNNSNSEIETVALSNSNSNFQENENATTATGSTTAASTSATIVATTNVSTTKKLEYSKQNLLSRLEIL